MGFENLIQWRRSKKGRRSNQLKLLGGGGRVIRGKLKGIV